MKKIVLTSLFLSLAVFIFSLLFPLLSPPERAYTPPHNSEELPYAGKLTGTDDAGITVRALIGGETETMNMHDYLVGVLAAEMPASFEMEALRAQAAAARTYTLYKMLSAPSENHPEADVCDDIACCKAYASEDEMHINWGEDYEKYRAKMENAVASTDGVCITYSGQPALAVFHSFSPGMTESSENTWGGYLPYLRSVFSPETENDVPEYSSGLTVSLSDFESAIRATHPEAVFSEGYSPFSDDAVYSESGRLLSVTAGGVSLSGTEMRSVFGLRSAAFTMEFTGDAVVFTCRGSGHGVGMSQYGANVYAKEGWDYREILLHYYEGAELKTLGEMNLR